MSDRISIDPFDVDGGDLAGWLAVPNLAFKHHSPPPEGYLENRRELYRTQRLLAARDGGRIVGTLRSWDMNVTVPGGGTVVADAVSTVTVRPTHTRRGLLTGMITRELTEAAARGSAVAVLIASEAAIYGRFGFGPATTAADAVADTGTARLRPEALALAEGVELTEIDNRRLREIGPALYERSRRPGDIDRTDFFWDQLCELVPTPWPSTDSDITLLATDRAGEPVGVLRYRAEERWRHRVADASIDVRLLLTASPAAAAAFWAYLVRVDLVTQVRLTDTDPDPEVRWMLADPRAYQTVSQDDFLWARVLDPVALLSNRRYAGPAGRVVVEVTDPAGWAAGRFALETGPDGSGRCTPTGDPAEADLPVDLLGQAWLGAPGLVAAARAGRARDLTPGALDRLAALLHTPRAPYSSTWF